MNLIRVSVCLTMMDMAGRLIKTRTTQTDVYNSNSKQRGESKEGKYSVVYMYIYGNSLVVVSFLHSSSSSLLLLLLLFFPLVLLLRLLLSLLHHHLLLFLRRRVSLILFLHFMSFMHYLFW